MLSALDSPTEHRAGTSPIDALECEITTLAAHLNAATYRFLTLIAEFDHRGGWDGFGMRSCAHWLNWKCGIGLIAGREKLRVAHALERLPRIADAMRCGALSYAKVRAMTRVATSGNEELLLSIAHDGTASQLETVVRHYRRTQRLEQDQARHEARSFRYYWDDDGCLVLEGRLPREQGALVVKALEAADEVIRAEVSRASTSGATESSANLGRLRHESASVPAAASGVADERTGDSAETCSGGRPLASPEEPVPSWSNRQADALSLMAETLLAHGPRGLRGGDKHLVHVHVDLSALCDPDADGQSAIERGPALPIETVRRLCCDGGLVTWLEDGVGRTLDVGRKTRAIPAALRRALEKRDHGCQFPGCTNRRFVDAHHVEHWADGGATRLDNLVLLCGHHHRLVHEGGFRVMRDGDRLRFARPDGRILPAAPAPIRTTRGVQGLFEQHARFGLKIDEETAITNWRGERADYGHIVKVLCQQDEWVEKQGDVPLA